MFQIMKKVVIRKESNTIMRMKRDTEENTKKSINMLKRLTEMEE